MTKKRRDNIVAFLILILIFICYQVFTRYIENEERELSENGIISVARVIERDLPGARTISNIGYKFIYYTDGIKIENWDSTDERHPVGSCFEVTYLPGNPKVSRLEFEHPVSKDSVCAYFKGDCPFNVSE